ncbi:MAG TPA: murein transglycosylase A [Accumulibacter sp.]|jgi:membrane-bound lytic murein transglycosylase A|nr:murein transglycosylase A [Accumulibacter sp.]HQC79663.1 murein transglycosylase A [Accumulibacter sp.]
MPKRQLPPARHAAPLIALLLAACSTTMEAPTDDASRACAPCGKATNAVATGSTAASPDTTTSAATKPMQAARWSDLPGWAEDDLAAAWPAFLHSCRGLASRPQWPRWKAVCDEAKAMAAPSAAGARRFFESRLQPWQVVNGDGSGSGLVTGYYEPLLHGSRTRGKPYLHPVLGVPADLLTVDLGAAQPDVKSLRLRGRLQGNKVVPYYSRAEIAAREKEYADRTLLWVDDPVELFFLQVQGSGRVKLTDGSTARLAYADQNGHVYQSIGRRLVDRGELTLEQATMPGIKHWARSHPSRVTELLNANPSYVFFREQSARGNDSDGPNGALGVPLSAERSIAVDPRHVPLGAPVFLATRHPESSAPLRRLVLAQDTGSAIRGAVRADLFYGFGDAAGNQAGRMKQPGSMWVLLPPAAAKQP